MASRPPPERTPRRKAIRTRLRRLRDPEWIRQKLGPRFVDTYRGAKLAVAYAWNPDPPLAVDPPMVPAQEAHGLSDDEVVLGFVEGGEARAYPWGFVPHVVNDTVAGRAVAVVLCPMCSSGTAFDRTVDGRPLTFQAQVDRTRGLVRPRRGERRYVYNGTAAIQDRETGSVWSPFLALAFRGSLKGRTLQPLPLWQMEWRAWRDLHPDTWALDVNGMPRVRKLGIEHEHIDDAFRSTVSRWDERLPHNALVLGVVTPGGQRAYRVEDLVAGSGVVNDEVEGTPVVILSHPARGNYGAAAFSRETGGRVLTFDPTPGGAVDRETGSRWTLEGRAVEGPLAGTQLEFAASHVGMWYVWAAHFPDLHIAT
ncbi:MAG: DUF3179 domain-containing (seleno)protein [Actinomycetota bacterium]